MLEISRDTFIDAAATVGPGPHHAGRQIMPMSVLANLRRHGGASAVVIVSFVALGLGFALTSTPLYTASTTILIDARHSHGDGAGSSNRSLAELGMDPASIDSQVAVLGSEQIASAALKQLHLDRDSEFATPTTLPGRLVQEVRQAMGRTAGRSDASDDIPAPIIDGFMRSLDVKREQQTYVLAVSFAARTPERAAAIVNTIASIYVNGQVEAELEARSRSVAWLKDQLTGVRGEIAAAEQAVRSLRTEMGGALAVVPGTTPGAPASLVPPDPVRLQTLEHGLDEKRAFYGALVERINAAQQQQSMPVSDASVLKPARVPDRRSSPNVPLIGILSAIAGFAAAMGFATWREMADQTFRLPSQVEGELGLRFLGALPRLVLSRSEQRVVLQGDWRPGPVGQARLDGRSRLGEQVRLRFAGPLRAVRLAAAVFSHDRPAVVGITSALAGEGRSTVATNLAGSMAGSGRRTLLIDADLRQFPRSRTGGLVPKLGLLDVIGGSGDLDHAIVGDTTGGFDWLPARGVEARGDNVLGREDLEKVLSQVARRYDVVVLDLPPLSALSEVAAISPAVGALVLVVAWGHTDRAVVAASLQAAPLVANRIVGAVLNRVNVGSLRRRARDPRDLFYLDDARRARTGQA